MKILNPPTRSSLVSAIKRCTAEKSLLEGKSIHADIIKFGFLPETQLYNHLLNMYSKSLDLVSSHQLFDEMPQKNLVSFSTLLSGYSQSDTPQAALQLVPLVHNQALLFNQFVFSSLILSCSKLKRVKEGKQIHAQLIVSGFESDPIVTTTLMDMYSKIGDINHAVSVFYSCSDRDSVMYNSMVSKYVNFEFHEEAVELFLDARWDIDLVPTQFTFGSMIKACSNLGRVLGEQVHGLTIKTGFDSNCYVGTSLVDLYGNFGDMGGSNKIFESIQGADLALYNSMISGFSINNLYGAAITILRDLKLAGFCPNECTFSSILKACGGLKWLILGKVIHAVLVKREYYGDLVVKTAIIDMYNKCGCLKESFRLFEKMSVRSTILYNSMINGLVQCGYSDRALRMFIDMTLNRIIPDRATFISIVNSSVGANKKTLFASAIKHRFGDDLMVQNAFLDSLIKGGDVKEARFHFNNMKEKNIITWTSIISGLSELGLDGEAFELFQEMKSFDFSPNSFTFSSVLKACANLADLEKGRYIHGSCIKHGIMDDEFAKTTLLDMYARCGALEESYKLFSKMTRRDVVSWNTMIKIYAQHGKGQDALEVFRRMEECGIKPNNLSFTSLLSACSHCGLIEGGICVFESISSKHNMVPSMEHYACIVDMYGRARMLDRAKKLIDSMPFKPDGSIWRTFLASCKLHGDLNLAETASKHILDLEGVDNSTLVLLSNIYSDLGKWDEVERVRRTMRVEGGKKEVGLSWVQAENR